MMAWPRMHKGREETIQVYVKERRAYTGPIEQVVSRTLQEDLSNGKKFSAGG